jgi:Flp pilus assembly protein TadG
MKGLEKKVRRGERGSALALSAIAMLSILLAAGLGVDISRFYTAKTELQNAADAAALAAALL